MLFERTALSRKPAKLARMEIEKLREEDKVTPDLIFRFLYSRFPRTEGRLCGEGSGVCNSAGDGRFILELGAGFCFVARRQRMQTDDRDYYLDLLFSHRKLRRLIGLI